MTLVARTTPIDDPGPLVDLLPRRDGLAWLTGRDGMVGSGQVARIDGGLGPERFTRAEQRLRRLLAEIDVRDEVALPGTGPVAFGSFTFSPDRVGSALVVPATVVGRAGDLTWLTTIAADDAPRPPRPDAARARHHDRADRPRYAGASLPDVRWLEAVAAAVDRIEDGALDKVVLARDVALWAEEPFDARVLVRRLAGRFPGCFTFLVDGLLGATPELLVSREQRTVRSRALAGTVRRDPDPRIDEELGAALLASVKDRAEHAFLADEVERMLRSRLASLQRGHEPELLRLDNVTHLSSRFVGQLPEDDPASALGLAGLLHPTPAVGGMPRAAALAVIDELEGLDRGRYSGPVGWVDGAGDGEWGIALRCAEVHGARARLFAGAGIVAGSLPEAELEETRLKLRAMRGAFDGG